MVRTRTSVKPGLLLQPYILSRLAGQLLEAVSVGNGFADNEYAVASWLNICGEATPTELAADLGMKPTTLTAVIERLVTKGLVRRLANPDDGRSYVVELTAKGKATNARAGEHFDRVMTRLRANLAGDREEILAHMRVLEDAMRKTLDER
jgi:MarR family transcriptional regulator, 2-MHQ and catechol-resistance regulon repressor